ncbi:MAG TPA: GNAT family N-acetyltransferase [Pyrinomonadaceae bacterium]|nr:GNAT family N-acetyltransferase [Pyrinomonadaceae bacterium]
MEIRIDDLSGNEVIDLLIEHRRSMFEHSPPESVHALETDELRADNITFWSTWEGDSLMGCGALKEIDATHGEVKAMRTAAEHLRKGVANRILDHIIAESKDRNYERISLETGTADAFDAARRLYEKRGFEYCGPFGDYVDDPHSVFLTMKLNS